MRYLITFIGLVLASFSSSCDTKKEVAATPETAEPDTVVVVMEPAPPEDSLVVYFEKTPCFGQCPVFKVRVFESGFAIYEGLNFAELMGKYSYRFSEKTLKEIYEMAEAIDYFNLESNYDDPRVTDLPSTISEINLNGKSHRVKARMGTPEKLKGFHENLGVMLREKDWKPYTDR